MIRPPHDAQNNDYNLRHAIDVIRGQYNKIVSVEAKKKDLIKFGHNPSVGDGGNRFTLWYTGKYESNETYPAINTNPIDSISSNNASDTENVWIEGHTEADNLKTFFRQKITLNGQTRVALTTPLNRVTRVEHADETAINLQGEIYVYQNTAITAGKPDDETKIHLTVPAGQNKSQKGSTSISNEDFWIVTGYSAGYLQKTGANVADVILEVRNQGGVFKPFAKPIVIKTGDDSKRDFSPYLIIPQNADVRLTASSSATGQNITGDIQGYLAKVIGQAS